MIRDQIQHAGVYNSLIPAWAKALQWLSSHDLPALAPGRHDVEGDRLFVMIEHGPLAERRDADAVWETHRRYADLQYVVRGAERFGWVPRESGLTVKTLYDAKRDAEFYQPPVEPTWFTLRAGEFAAFFPQDAHAPGQRPAEYAGAPVCKAVVKLLLEG